MKWMCVFFIFLLAACSEQKGPASPNSTGNAQKDELVQRIVDDNPGMFWKQGVCVVDEATKDGRYSVGDLSQLSFDLNQRANNDPDVYKAFFDSIAVCTQN